MISNPNTSIDLDEDLSPILRLDDDKNHDIWSRYLHIYFIKNYSFYSIKKKKKTVK